MGHGMKHVRTICLAVLGTVLAVTGSIALGAPADAAASHTVLRMPFDSSH